MGSAHRSDTVVDERLRIKGVDSLRVCDASVFPVIPNGNYKCGRNYGRREVRRSY